MQGNKRSEYLKWNPEMDNSLREFYGEYTPSPDNRNVWRYVAEKMSQRFGRTITEKQCASRWEDHAGPNARHIKFTPEEDEALIILVEQYGENNWKLIAEKMPSRNARQCRERWKNYLSKNCGTNLQPFTLEEDQLLIKICSTRQSPHWDRIAKFFSGRTSNRIKNRCRYLFSLNSNHKSLYTPIQQIPVPVLVPIQQNPRPRVYYKNPDDPSSIVVVNYDESDEIENLSSMLYQPVSNHNPIQPSFWLGNLTSSATERSYEWNQNQEISSQNLYPIDTFETPTAFPDEEEPAHLPPKKPTKKRKGR